MGVRPVEHHILGCIEFFTQPGFGCNIYQFIK